MAEQNHYTPIIVGIIAILFIVVAVFIVRQPNCNSLNGIDKDDCLLDAANETGSLKYCEGLSLEDLKQECVRRVAAVHEDLAACDTIADTQTRFYCQASVAEAIPNPSICPEIPNTHWSQVCFDKVARASQDATWCGQLTTNQTRINCYNSIAQSTQDPSVCLMLLEKPHVNGCLYVLNSDYPNTATCDAWVLENNIDYVQRDLCYKSVARETQNKDACMKILDDSIQEECMTLFI